MCCILSWIDAALLDGNVQNNDENNCRGWQKRLLPQDQSERVLRGNREAPLTVLMAEMFLGGIWEITRIRMAL